MRNSWLAGACALVIMVPGAGQADDKHDCAGTDADRAIQACTAIINSGRASQPDLATAHSNRGVAYSRKGDFEHAVADVTKANELAPRQATQSPTSATSQAIATPRPKSPAKVMQVSAKPGKKALPAPTKPKTYPSLRENPDRLSIEGILALPTGSQR